MSEALPDHQRYISNLDRRIAEFTKAVEQQDEDAAWASIREVLGWLYNTEEAARKRIPTYFADRDADSGARTLGGLIWVRGLVVHHQAETRAAVLRPVQHHMKLGGKMVPVQPKMKVGGQMVDAKAYMRGIGWPPRSALPTGRPERNGRDLMYDQHVAGQSLVKPLQDAREYLASLGT